MRHTHTNRLRWLWYFLYKIVVVKSLLLYTGLSELVVLNLSHASVFNRRTFCVWKVNRYD